MTETNRDFVVVAGIAAYVSDGVLQLILEDSRAGLRMPQWKECGKEELSWIASWDEDVWQAMVGRGLIGKLSARDIHGWALRAAL
eukprot:6360567-Lingulodinium_polyedra.AAC.1